MHSDSRQRSDPPGQPRDIAGARTLFPPALPLGWAALSLAALITVASGFAGADQSQSGDPAPDRESAGPSADAANRRPTFTRDVLPILQENCQTCHRPGQIGPMSLLTYEETRPWAKAIRNEVAQRNMPPFPAAGPHGFFQDDLRLPQEEIDTIVAWVDQGAPRGRPEDAPPARTWPEREALLEDPDLILDFPEFHSRTGLTDDWVLLYSDHVFEEDTYIDAMELRPSNYALPHHVAVYSASPNLYVPEDRVLSEGDEHSSLRILRENPTLMTENFLYTWLPGKGPERRPGGIFKVRAGDRIVLQVHVAPTPEPQSCGMQMAFRLADGVYDTEVMGLLARFQDLEIPPGDPDYTRTRVRRIPGNLTVQAFRVHMHVRGKSTKFIFHYPDGTSETVLDIPEWDFDWQRLYILSEPMTVPPGTKWQAVAKWDNSAGNPLNPDPTSTVTWGPLTHDEMYSGTIYCSRKRDEPLRIRNGRLVSRLPAAD